MFAVHVTTTPASPLVIHDVAQLRALRNHPGQLGARPLVLAVSGLDADERGATAARITSYAHECGCSLGATCLTASFAAALLILVAKFGVSTAFLWRTPAAALCGLIGAALGKTYGIVRARRRMNHEIDALIALQSDLRTREA
jgi:hypothetical protein